MESGDSANASGLDGQYGGYIVNPDNCDLDDSLGAGGMTSDNNESDGGNSTGKQYQALRYVSSQCVTSLLCQLTFLVPLLTTSREQDRFLPIANVARIMKLSIPKTGKIAKDAKECVQECVSEFVSFITSEASDRCHQVRGSRSLVLVVLPVV